MLRRAWHTAILAACSLATVGGASACEVPASSVLNSSPDGAAMAGRGIVLSARGEVADYRPVRPFLDGSVDDGAGSGDRVEQGGVIVLAVQSTRPGPALGRTGDARLDAMASGSLRGASLRVFLHNTSATRTYLLQDRADFAMRYGSVVEVDLVPLRGPIVGELAKVGMEADLVVVGEPCGVER